MSLFVPHQLLVSIGHMVENSEKEFSEIAADLKTTWALVWAVAFNEERLSPCIPCRASGKLTKEDKETVCHHCEGRGF